MLASLGSTAFLQYLVLSVCCPVPVPRYCAWIKFVGVSFGQCLVSLRSFTEPQPSRATVLLGVWWLNEDALGFTAVQSESGSAAFETAVDVLSVAKGTHIVNRSCVTCQPDDRFFFHAGRSQVTCAVGVKVNATLPLDP